MSLHARLMVIVTFVVLGIFAMRVSLCAESLSVEINTPVEISVISDSIYANPHYDVGVTCTFVGPGLTETVDGFWDGGRTYRFRFSPPCPGVWRYLTICSDTANHGMQHVRGAFTATPSTSADPFRSRGWVKVSMDGHYLTYDDDEPYFYFGDTAWEITWRSTVEELRRYLADRKRKGFNVVQVVTMSHQHIWSYGVRNRNDVPYFLNDDFDILNPRYFDYLDTIVRMANDSGMAVALVPLWAAFSYLYYPNGTDFFLNHQQCIQIARYIGARYAGSNVFWIVGGDNIYDTPERKEFWDEFAHMLRSASGGRHLTAVHPHGWGTSFQYFDNLTDWLDFNMYQSSHLPNITFTYDAGSEGYKLAPARPVLNGEAVYEDIESNLWLPGDTVSPHSVRIEAVDVRQASYESVLAGAIVGMVYGGNGIWQWHYLENDGSTHSPRYLIDDALSFPGSTQIGIMKRLMERYGWYRFVPRQDLVLATARDQYLPLAENDRFLVAYFKRHLDSAVIDLSNFGTVVKLTWIDPASGETRTSQTRTLLTDTVTVTPLDTNDWVFVAEKGVAEQSTVKYFDLKPPKPNPFHGQGSIAFFSPISGLIRFRLWNEVGQIARTSESHFDGGSGTIPVDALPAGAYFYSVEFRDESGNVVSKYGELISLGAN